MYERNGSEIAIVGINCRFPKAASVDEFWDNLVNGREGITFFEDEELAEAGVDRSLLESRNYVKASAILDNIDQFDASFFGMTPKEAEIMDPQHRLFLENCWQALELAGYAPEKFNGRIGVYAGVFTSTYLVNLYSTPGLVDTVGELSVRHANEKDYLATRVSYKMNLKGPSVSVQTSCSTSLVAVHMAVQSLLGGECDMALAGGVSVVVPQKTGYMYQDGSILSPDGHCRPFDANAKGTIFGSGAGVVVLKRLEDALESGDTIYAVIKGTAINNDGADKIGFTAPSVKGQAEVIADALTMAEVEPHTVGMVEAHGTGTPLGDPIEISALTQVYRTETEEKNYCAIGSVKSNIGHLGAASGIAGLIKATLSLYHKKLLPTLHFEEPNPNIDFASSPFYVNTELRDWNQSADFPRRAGVSSFGMGGTNAHVVLEEALPSEQETTEKEVTTEQLLILSAKTDAALDSAIANMKDFLDQKAEMPLVDAAYTLQAGRREFPRRAFVIARSGAEASEILSTPVHHKIVRGHAATEERQIAFVFSGQGSQYVGMAKGLYESETAFRETFDACCELLQPTIGLDLRALLYEADDEEAAAVQLQQTAFAQPALFAVEYSLAKLLGTYGIEPSVMLGHSIGEYVAACLAGVFSLEDALHIVAMRGRLMQKMPTGKMLSVSLSEAQVQTHLTGMLSLAAVNAPQLCVVAGPADEIEVLQAKLQEKGIVTRLLVTSHAFHSSMMDPILDEFAQVVSNVKRQAPSLPYLSNLTGQWIQPEEAVDPQYWAKHLRSAVRFSDGVKALLADPNTVILEVGPGQALTSLIKQHATEGNEPHVVPLARHAKDRQSDRAVLLQALGRLWLTGVKIVWSALHEGQPNRLPLPTYPFEHKRYWVDKKAALFASSEVAAATSVAEEVSANVYTLAWQRTVPVAPASGAGHDAPWLLVGNITGTFGRLLIEALTNRIIPVIAAEDMRPAAAFQEYLTKHGATPRHIVYLGENSTDTAPLEELAAVIEKEAKDQLPIVNVLTSGAVNVAGGEIATADKTELVAAARDLAERIPASGFYRVDVQLPAAGLTRLDRLGLCLADELLAERREADIAYAGIQRYALTLQPVPTTNGESCHDTLGKYGVVLFTGAPDTFALHVTEGLTSQGHTEFAFLVPADSPLQEQFFAQQLTADAAEIAARLTANGVGLHLERGYTATAESIVTAIGQVKERFHDVSGVIVGPTAADTAEATLRSLIPWLEANSVEFVLSLSKREGESASPRKAEAALGALAAGLETELGIAAMAVRLDGRGWTITEQAQAASVLLERPFPHAILASRSEFAVDAPLFLTDSVGAPHENQAALETTALAVSAVEGDSASIEQGITVIWQDLFGIPSIDVNDDFFALGGNSLQAIQLMSNIQERYQIELQIENLFDEPTIAGLTKQVEEALAAAAPASVVDGEDLDELERLLNELEGHSQEDIKRALNNVKA